VASPAGGRRASRHSHSSAMSLDRRRETRHYRASPSATCVKAGSRRASGSPHSSSISQGPHAYSPITRQNQSSLAFNDSCGWWPRWPSPIAVT
jgi:hypothetical protein